MTTLLPAKTKGDLAYRTLRQAIVTFEIPAGVPLDEAELMARYGLGRTPLREALKRLALEHLVVWPAHRTPYVRAVSVDDLAPLYETRFLLEVPVARLAAERITEPELAGLEAILDELQETIAAGHTYDVVELDFALHAAIARGTHNRYLAEAITALNCSSLQLWYRAHQQLGLSRVQRLHTDLVAALHDHDPARAEALAREHIVASHRRQLALSAPG